MNDLTVEQFWQYPGCESYSREEAEEILRNLRHFAELCYAVYSQQKALGQDPTSILDQ